MKKNLIKVTKVGVFSPSFSGVTEASDGKRLSVLGETLHAPAVGRHGWRWFYWRAGWAVPLLRMPCKCCALLEALLSPCSSPCRAVLQAPGLLQSARSPPTAGAQLCSEQCHTGSCWSPAGQHWAQINACGLGSLGGASCYLRDKAMLWWQTAFDAALLGWLDRSMAHDPWER